MPPDCCSSPPDRDDPSSGAAFPMFQLVYVSAAFAPFSPAELRQLLEGSRARNERVGITGMLLYHDGNFMQALEGREPAVHEVHARIKRDPRHGSMITLIQQPVAERSFAGWSMGFRDLRSADVRANPGYSHFLNDVSGRPELPREPGRALKLLASFRQSMR